MRFDGEDVTRGRAVPARALGHRLCAAGAGDFPGLTVHDNLRMGCKKGRRREEIIGRCLRVSALKRCSIAPAARCRAANSSCWRSPAAFAASALALLDEPTEGIQPSIIDEIVETLKRLRDKGGLTIILVEQNLDFIAAVSQRVLIIQKGTIIRAAKPSELHDIGLVGEFIGITD